MPYIPKDDREDYNNLISRVAALLCDVPADKRKGHANYIVTQILRKAWSGDKESYSNYNDILGVLEAAKLEFYRRFVAPYEDKAIDKNGDLD